MACLGFLNSCNMGASLAQGQYLLLLNNDTQVEVGAINHLLHTFDVSDEIGAVGQVYTPTAAFRKPAG